MKTFIHDFAAGFLAIGIYILMGCFMGRVIERKKAPPMPDHSNCWKTIEELTEEADFQQKRAEGWKMECKRLERKYGIRFVPKKIYNSKEEALNHYDLPND